MNRFESGIKYELRVGTKNLTCFQTWLQRIQSHSVPYFITIRLSINSKMVKTLFLSLSLLGWQSIKFIYYSGLEFVVPNSQRDPMSRNCELYLHRTISDFFGVTPVVEALRTLSTIEMRTRDGVESTSRSRQTVWLRHETFTECINSSYGIC